MIQVLCRRNEIEEEGWGPGVAKYFKLKKEQGTIWRMRVVEGRVESNFWEEGGRFGRSHQ